MVSNIAPVPKPALKIWFIDHVMTVDASRLPEVVAKDGFEIASTGSVIVNELV